MAGKVKASNDRATAYAQSVVAEGGVYQIRNTVNGKRYIGSAVDFKRRFRNHRNRANKGTHHSIHFQSAWNKHGAKAFQFEILVVCPRNEILIHEQAIIDRELPEYNIAKIVSAPMLGMTHGPEAREKIAASKRGKKRPPEMVAATAEKIRGRPSPNKGRKMTPEQNARNAAAQRGKQLTPEHRRNISLGGKGLKKPQQWLKKHCERMKGNKNWLGKTHPKEWGIEISKRMTQHHEHKGESHTSAEWAVMFGITTKAFAARLHRWGNVDRIYVPRMQ